MLTSQSLIKHLRRVNLSLQHKIIPSITVAARSFQTTPEEYSVLKSESLDPSGKFWLDYANSKLHWDVKPKIAIDHSNAPFYRWFPDGQINVCHQMLDRHIEAGNGEVVAIAYDSVALTDAEVDTIIDVMDHIVRYKDAPICHQHDVSDSFYVIVKGAAIVQVDDENKVTGEIVMDDTGLRPKQVDALV